MFYYFSGLIFMEDSFNPSTQEVEAREYLSLKMAWSTEDCQATQRNPTS